MTFKEMMTLVSQAVVLIDRHGGVQINAPSKTASALRELAQAADDGRIIEVPLSSDGDGDTIEVPNMPTAQIPKVTCE